MWYNKTKILNLLEFDFDFDSHEQLILKGLSSKGKDKKFKRI